MCDFKEVTRESVHYGRCNVMQIKVLCAYDVSARGKLKQ